MSANIRSYILPILLIASLSSLAAAASLAISPAIAPPGSKISAKGSGFSPSETVTLAFDAASAGSATADSSGNFTASIVVPKSAQPGAHTIQATGQTSGSTASARFKVQTNWPSFKNLPTRTGVNPVENTINPGNGKFLTLAWQGQMGDLVDHSSPAVVNGVVYVGSFDGKLYAFNANGCVPQTLCQPLWSGATGNDITSSPAVANGKVFIGSADHKLYAFAANGGLPLTTNELNGIDVEMVSQTDPNGQASSFIYDRWSDAAATVIGSEAPRSRQPHYARRRCRLRLRQGCWRRGWPGG